MKNIQSEKIIKYHSLLLARNKRLMHGFFSKVGGVSTYPAVKSLNCMMKSYDKSQNVIANQTIVCNEFDYDINSLRIINQQHTNHVVTITNYSEITHDVEADAIVTDLKNVLLGIRTADCTPILLYEAQNKIIGAIHAGWKGALADIIDNTIDKMVKLGAMLPLIEVAIGPTIQQFSYEVDQSFYNRFVKHDDNQIFFKDSNRLGYLMFDLPGFCVYKFRKLGILKIDNTALDTYSNEEIFFSFRKATHMAEDVKPIECGCQISVIGMSD